MHYRNMNNHELWRFFYRCTRRQFIWTKKVLASQEVFTTTASLFFYGRAGMGLSHKSPGLKTHSTRFSPLRSDIIINVKILQNFWSTHPLNYLQGFYATRKRLEWKLIRWYFCLMLLSKRKMTSLEAYTSKLKEEVFMDSSRSVRQTNFFNINAVLHYPKDTLIAIYGA